ncbi:MAG: endopeptidase La, partial [Alphaproteobacteria bacterium]
EKFTPELDESLLRTGYIALNLVKNELKDDAGDIIPEEEIDFDKKEIKSGDIYKVGVLCKVVKKLKLPDGSVNVLVHGMKRYRASGIISETPILKTRIEVFDDILETDEELDAYTRSVINQVKKLSEINPYFNEEMKLAMLNSPSPGALADLVAFAISLDIP